MGKRQKLDYNSDELVRNLKQSTGQGVDALFSPPFPPRREAAEELQVPAEEDRSVHAGTQARADANGYARIEEDLRKGLLNKKRLSSFTFRFRSKELEDLDGVAAELNREVAQKVSKNDIVRLGLNWLLKDYQQNKRKSMLASVLTRA